MLDERHLYAGIRYVETNPVRAGIVKKAEDYKWSSARRHVKGKTDLILSNDCYVLKKIKDWSVYLREKGFFIIRDYLYHACTFIFH